MLNISNQVKGDDVLINKLKNFPLYLVTLALIVGLMPIGASLAQVSDINHHWAASQINEWVGKALIKGYPDGTFRPDHNITRAEFMSLVNNAFGYTQQTELAYRDVPADAWYAETVAKAKAAGYISGYDDGTMKPNHPISRAEAATIIMSIKSFTPDAAAADQFSDSSSIAGWSRGAVGATANAGIMGGYPDGTFRAENLITRAEAVTALNKALAGTVQNFTYDQAGTYGPETGSETIYGDVTIKAKEVTLQNTVITGNLTIDQAVGEGNVTLKKVIVTGCTYVYGGGANSVYFIDTKTGKTYVMKDHGPVRIVVSGTSEVNELVAQSSVQLVEVDLTGPGIAGIVVEKKVDGAMEISLTGAVVESLIIKSEGVTVNTDQTTKINTLAVKSDRVTVHTQQGSTITTVEADPEVAEVAVTGNGKIEVARVNTAGVTIDAGVQVVTREAPPQNPTQPATSGGGEKIKVQSITVTDASGNQFLNINIPGGTLQLTAHIEPANASDKRLRWSAPVDQIHPFNAVTVDENTGLVTAISQGRGKVVASALDGSGVTGEAVVIVNYAFAINSEAPPQGKAGEPYSYQMTSSLDGSGTVSYSLAGGTLPEGLTLTPTGCISGTPARMWGETCTCTVQADHSSGAWTNREFALTILPNVSITAQIDAGSEQDQTIEQGGFSIIVPAGALGHVTGEQTLQVSTMTDMPAHDFNGTFPAFAEIGTYGVTIGEIKEFASPLTLEIPFESALVDSDLPVEDAVKVSYYGEFSEGGKTYGQWVNVPCRVDVQTGKVVFQTNHLTSWRIEYLIRGYKTKNTTNFSIMYKENGPAVPVGFKQYTQPELAELMATNLEAAYQDYKDNGIKMPVGTTTVILKGGLDQSETSTVLGNICMATVYYDSDAHVKFDCYHELMHTVEREYFYIPYYLSNRWLMEAVADTAAGIAVPEAAKMADGTGLKPSWFDEVITTADGSHEYAAAFFIAYMCDVQHYARWLGGAITPSVLDKNETLKKIGSMLDTLDKGSNDVFAALDSWLKNQDPIIENCPDLKSAYANFVHRCFYSPYSPLVLPDGTSIAGNFATEEVTLNKNSPSATIELNMSCRGGIQTKVVNIEPWEGEHGALPGIRALKIEYMQGEPADSAVVASQIHSNDYLDNQAAGYAYGMLPDPQVKDRIPFVWALNGQRLYLTGANLSPDYQAAVIKISDPT